MTPTPTVRSRPPPALRAGDRVAVVAPSGPVLSASRLAAGLDVLRSWGLEPVLGRHVHDAVGHLAGADVDRAGDLGAAIRDPSVRAVLAARGGYGALRIAGEVDWGALADDPKIIVGFSDVTLLLLAAWQRASLVTVHGPFVGRLGLQTDDARAHLRRLLTEPVALGVLPARGRTVHGGTAEGRLVGGNLATICSTLGTPLATSFDRCVLLLEEVGEAPYRLDRMLTQLRFAGALDGAAGVAVGSLVRCAPGERPSGTAEEVVAERLGDLGVPVVEGFPLGHVDHQLAVPLGVRARLDGDAGTLTLLEPATTGER